MVSRTAGIQLTTQRRWFAQAVELFSSMRFAISLLTIIAIASIIGTVLKQNEPVPDYINQFGEFWFNIFNKLSLYSVYSAWWFLLIMGFLVLSTSLCVARNGPKMLRDIKSWRENIREESLHNIGHHAEWTVATPMKMLVGQLAQRITAKGYKTKIVDKNGATLIVAKRGAANKWGYIFAHSAIIIICIGGLLDSDLSIRLQQWIYHKTPFSGNGIIADIPAQHRLGLGNPTFRGNTLIAEGSSSSTTLIAQQNGVLIQDLPITIYLKRFIINYYSTGMPKLFASDVVVRDNASGYEFPATIKVNSPLIYKGLAIFQSSFQDGGSKLRLTAHSMQGDQDQSFPLSGEVNGTTPLWPGKDNALTVEWTDLRPFNVENMPSSAGKDVRAVNVGKSMRKDVVDSIERHLGSGAKGIDSKDLKNVGPSVQYKLRDKAGQAKEYLNYMQPIEVDGAYVFLAGVRDLPDEAFRYLRIPADDNDSVNEWMRLRAALHNPALQELAARRYAQHAISPQEPAALRDQLYHSALKGLQIFAGDANQSGYVAIAAFLANVPAGEQGKAADIFMKILNGSVWELWQVAREKAGLAPVPADDKHGRYLELALNALADTGFYHAPVYLQLSGFDEVKASVFQVTRSPGKKVVYIGCLFLVLGVFSMLYIRERRLWVWLRTQEDGMTHAMMAMSTQRKTLDFEQEFEALKAKLKQSA